MSLPVYIRVMEYLKKLPRHRIRGDHVEDVGRKLAQGAGTKADSMRYSLMRLEQEGFILIERTDGAVTVILTGAGVTSLKDHLAEVDQQSRAAHAMSVAVTSNDHQAALGYTKDSSKGLGTFTARRQKSNVQPHELEDSRALLQIVAEKGMIVGSDVAKSIARQIPSLESDQVLVLCRHMASDDLISCRVAGGVLVGVSTPDKTLEMHAAVAAKSRSKKAAKRATTAK